jgi:ribonuclease P protein component
MPTPDVTADKVLTPKNGTLQILKNRKDFVAASKSGHKGVASSLIIQMNPRPAYGPSVSASNSSGATPILRYGLTASKKTGNAVCRNRAKRRMRALVHDHLADHGQAGCDYILIARHNTATIAYDRLVKDFHHALKRVHLSRSHQSFSGKRTET